METLFRLLHRSMQRFSLWRFLACCALLSCVVVPVKGLPQADSEPLSGNGVMLVQVLDSEGPQQESVRYFITLLDKALAATTEEFGQYRLVPVDIPYEQRRVMRLLDREDVLDVMHSMTSQYREDNFIPVRVPLLMGMIGHRMLLVRASNLAQFKKVKTPEQLKTLIACQGAAWPDSDVLEENGYQVARVSDFDAMFAMLEKQRCDYFPRGINEVFHDFEVYNGRHGELAIVDHLLLYYPAPTYFFVSKRNPRLAQRLEQGLLKLVAQGEILNYMQQHPTTRDLFPLSQWQDMTVFELQNKTLKHIPQQTGFWLSVE